MDIVAIGGGELEAKQTLPLDELVVALTQKDRPHALFIPTASGDAQNYCDTFERIYGRTLGCRTACLRLLADGSDRSLAKHKIERADLIYVGGGNTLRMMKFWRRSGVDRLLCEAARRGTVLSGLSAGAICWHTWGHSDSRSFAGTEGWAYVRVKGLGLVEGMFCPHLDAEQRHPALHDMVARRGGLALACDNRAALHYHDRSVRCVSAVPEAQAYTYRKTSQGVEVTAYEHGQTLAL